MIELNQQRAVGNQRENFVQGIIPEIEMVGDGVEARSKFQYVGLRLSPNNHFQGQRDAHPEQQ